MVGDFPRIDGAKLRHRRICAGLSQRGLADRARAAGLSISDSQLSKIERDLMRPRPSSLVAIAAALGVTPDELLTPPDTSFAGDPS